MPCSETAFLPFNSTASNLAETTNQGFRTTPMVPAPFWYQGRFLGRLFSRPGAGERRPRSLEYVVQGRVQAPMRLQCLADLTMGKAQAMMPVMQTQMKLCSLTSPPVTRLLLSAWFPVGHRSAVVCGPGVGEIPHLSTQWLSQFKQSH